MALRFEKGKRRPQPARLKDVAKRSANGTVNHNPDGTFTTKNRAAVNRGTKAAIKRQLGSGATSEAVERLYSDTKVIFLALSRAVGSSAPQVQDTLARRARWGVLSAHYALRAAELGLETDAGQACLELALKLDARAERLDVTALDLANRLEGEPDQQAAADATRALFTRKAVTDGS